MTYKTDDITRIDLIFTCVQCSDGEFPKFARNFRKDKNGINFLKFPVTAPTQVPWSR